jgi:hypothetical protein
METGSNNPQEAAAAAVMEILMPRDETIVTGLDPEPEGDAKEPSADLLDKSDYGSEAFANNPGKNLCVHLLSSDGDDEMGETEDENTRHADRSNMSGNDVVDPRGEPNAASTPLREEMNRFRIVDIEPEKTIVDGINTLGKQGTACGTAAGEAMDLHSDANSANGDAHSAIVRNDQEIQMSSTVGDANSAHRIPSGSDANSAASTQHGDANSARFSDANAAATARASTNISIPLRLQKVPAMFKAPPPPPPKQAVETPAVPSATYKAIMAGRIAKNANSVIAGTGLAKAKTNCGSFFNPGDNRVLRSVYKENVATLTVSSLSFNPVSWECSACPKKHSILGGGGRRKSLLNWGGEDRYHPSGSKLPRCPALC